MANISGRNRRVLSTRTFSDLRIESYCKLRDNILAEEPTQVDMYRRRSNFDAGERWFKFENEASGWRMRKLRE